MRFRVLIALSVAATLAVAAPAYAQRQSLADRVAALERQAANPQANLDLLNRLNDLRSQMQQMQGTIEQLQHENDLLKQQVKDQYLDLDGRLNRLEGGAAPVAPGDAGTPAQAAGAAASGDSKPAPKPAAAVVDEKPPSVHGDPGLLASASDEKVAYDVAFDALKNGKYDESAQLFKAFLELYPNGVYAPNALYWLGESFYATKDYKAAEAQFRDLVARYPTHDKASGGLLKLGLSQLGEGQPDVAQQTLTQVIKQYPGSSAANLAQDRLRSIQIGKHLN